MLRDGIAGETGDRLVTESPILTSGNVWYVDFTNGTDAVSPAGRERNKPLKTFAQANTNAATGDIVVLLSGHAEIYTASVTISKELTIIGEGLVEGVPQASFQLNAAASSVFILTGARVQFRNVRFRAHVQDCASNGIDSQLSNAQFIGCYFESGEHNTGPWLKATAAPGTVVSGCTFVSAPTNTTAPASAVKHSGASHGFTILDTVFDGGTIGYSNGIACDLSAAALDSVRIEGVTLTRGADLAMHASSTGFVNVSATGGGRVTW
jgi:hypothetical protein